MSAHLQIADGVRAVVTDDGGTLMDVKSGLIFALNSVGSRIWRELMQGRTLEDVASNLSSEFDVHKDQLEADLRLFIAQLAEKRLIRITHVT